MADSGPAALVGNWKSQKFDLNHVNKIGNLAGSKSVWVAFLWISNDSVAAPNGAFIDDVVLWMTRK